MAKITQEPKISLNLTLHMSESEARALNALTGYGTDQFLEMFYENLGETHLSPHEDGLRGLFEGIKKDIPTILDRLSSARRAFYPQKISLKKVDNSA